MHPHEHLRLLKLNDPLLKPLLEAWEEEARKEEMERLLAGPVRRVIDDVVSRQRGFDSILDQDADDIVAIVFLRLVRKLALIRTAEGEAIRSLDDYVRTLTSHAVYELLRRRFPQRTRLKNRLRYLLSRDARFALWEWNGILVCGVAASRGDAPADHGPPLREATSRTVRDSSKPPDAILALFESLKSPVRFDALVGWMMDLWAIKEEEFVDAEELSDSRASQLLAIESKQYFGLLWDEIKLLPPMQRSALLLNLRESDGTNGVALVLLLGVATFEEIAAIVGLSSERLAEVWSDLPLDDLSIASLLGLRRQQVINLRKSARERLARRMAAHSRPRR